MVKYCSEQSSKQTHTNVCIVHAYEREKKTKWRSSPHWSVCFRSEIATTMRFTVCLHFYSCGIGEMRLGKSKRNYSFLFFIRENIVFYFHNVHSIRLDVSVANFVVWKWAGGCQATTAASTVY